MTDTLNCGEMVAYTNMGVFPLSGTVAELGVYGKMHGKADTVYKDVAFIHFLPAQARAEDRDAFFDCNEHEEGDVQPNGDAGRMEILGEGTLATDGAGGSCTDVAPGGGDDRVVVACAAPMEHKTVTQLRKAWPFVCAAYAEKGKCKCGCFGAHKERVMAAVASRLQQQLETNATAKGPWHANLPH